ncbi:MAG: flagellar protein FlgN [Pirellulales bacterium]|nr:flagellar protein FlgN [Planctomycetales bacterium]
MRIDWEHELTDLLNGLSGVQTELLEVLGEKRRHLVTSDVAALAALQPREQDLLERLESCHDRRRALLDRAADEGLPNNSVRQLASSLDLSEQSDVGQRIDEAAGRARLVQHQSLTNWVLVQRTLIHLSQMLEIIATGGRLKPTYGADGRTDAGGTLVDQAA